MTTATKVLIAALENKNPLLLDVKVARTRLGRKHVISVDANAKLAKGNAKGWLTGGLSLAPASEAGGPTLCPQSTPQCRKFCVSGAGNAVFFTSVTLARIKLTQLLMSDPEAFVCVMIHDIVNLADKAKHLGLRAAIRLNTFSDIEWENVCPEIFAVASSVGVQPYDYTKILNRVVPDNYHLTISHSELNGLGFSKVKLDALLIDGANVAIPMAVDRKSSLPKTWLGHPVIDGDAHDLRFNDAAGSVVGLRSKLTKNGRHGGTASSFVLNIID